MMVASAQDDDLICLNISWFGFQIGHSAETKNKIYLADQRNVKQNTKLYRKYIMKLYSQENYWNLLRRNITVNSINEGGLKGYSDGN